ncbi:Leucine Rich repeats (2 copies) [Legionella massiliensis]|uniref:Leucine Rich repeats (2 copies) n=1 Tax=Legionella massiliensis TaxID=1034943 RepID=A0A078L5F3_9GAMM|nr:hypothetical protein [Legionella massiliensis]CDZ79158.1 Leucine Rich repeats (2 copies) [Legionella massiliensis]CEE14896.1 Leucine Rich repeats (2 copies) [Legionella massiliensis]
MMYQLENVGTRSMESLLGEFANIPDNTDYLIITDYENSNKTLEELQLLAQRIPQFITDLDLASINFNSLILPHAEHLFKSLPPQIKKLIVNPEGLATETTAQFCSLLNALTETGLRSLLLEGSGITHRPQADQIQILNAVPKTITHLGLTRQEINSENFRRFAAALSQLTHLDSLDLSENSFDQLTPEEFLEFLRTIPRNIRTLSLSSNNLCHFIGYMDRICEALPPGLQTLDLTSNGFGSAPGLPNLTRLPALKTLDFQGHCLEFSTFSQISTFFAEQLSPTVDAVHLIGTVLNPQQFSLAAYEQSGLDKIRAVHLQMMQQYSYGQYMDTTFWQIPQTPPDGSDDGLDEEQVLDSDSEEYIPSTPTNN